MKLLKKIIIFILLIVFVLASGLIYSGYIMYKTAIEETDLETKITIIKANDNYTEYNDLPEYYVKAVVDTEDHRFYDHKGVDYISIIRALITNIKKKEIVEGGSTITQQVAKNIFFTQEQKLVRKIAELFAVHDLEENYSKEDIFELYANTSYFGDGYYGIGEAAKGYLNKLPNEMTILECTLLAGIPNAPSIYAPTKNPDLATKRQIHVINRMLEKGDLSKEKAETLLKKLQ